MKKFILRADPIKPVEGAKPLYYTGCGGAAWVTGLRERAFPMGEAYAQYRLGIHNRTGPITNLRWSLEPK